MNENDIAEMNFLTKIYVQEGEQYPGLKKIMIAVFFICFIMIITEAIDKNSFVEAIQGKSLLGALASFGMILASNRKLGGYKSVGVKVQCENEYINIIYECVDKNDKLGRMREEVKLKYSSIKNIEYSNSIERISIEGMPIETISYLDMPGNKEIINDYSINGKVNRTYIFVSGENKEKIIKQLQLHTGLITREIN